MINGYYNASLYDDNDPEISTVISMISSWSERWLYMNVCLP